MWHARLGFSKLPRIVKCPGSITLESQAPPEPESEAAIEGRVAHWVAYQMFNGIDVPVGTEYMGLKVDEDMIAGARLWIESIPPGGVAEMPVMAPSIHATDCGGTPDYWLWEESTLTLTVPEYKYGYMIVDEFENEQLIGQAQGICDTMGYKPNKIVLIVVQPFGYVANKVRRWEITGGDFPAYVKPIIDAVNDGETTHVGPHCLYCPARQICGTFQAGASKVVEFSGLAEPVALTHAQMGAELTVLTAAFKVLEARKTVLDAMVEDAIRKGAAVPGWGMQSKKSPLAWKVDKQVVLETGKLIGINLAKPEEPITPTQAKDRKLLDAETLDSLASRPPDSMKLSPVSTELTRRIFQ